MLNTNMTLAATLSVNFVWTTSLCHLSSSHPCVILSCQLVVALTLVVLSLCRPLLLLSCQLAVTLPLAVLSLRHPFVFLSPQLVVILPLVVLSLRHPLFNSSHRLVVVSPLLVLLLCPVSPSPPLVVPAGCCVTSQRTALSSSCHIFVPPLVVLSRQLAVSPSSLVVHLLHRPLILSSCWLVVACPLVLLS